MTKILSRQEQYLIRQKKHKRTITALRILIFISFFVLWELAAGLGWIDDFIFSSPSRIVRCFLSMASDGTIFRHLGITLFETLVSFALVAAVTVIAAILLWINETVSKTAEPYMVVLNSLPKSALAPLLIVWLGANYRTIIVAGMSVAVFGSILSLYTCFRETDPGKLMLIRTLGGTRKDALFRVLLPASIPNLLSIMKVDIGLCLVGVIIGEFMASRQGLGYLIIYGSQVFKLDWVLMSIVLLCIAAMALYALLSLAERICTKKL